MAEATQGSPEQSEETPAETPVNITAEQVSEIVTKAMDTRVSGLMSSFDKRFGGLEENIRKTSMTAQEIDAERESAEAEELERLRRENAILSAGAEMPAAVKVFQELNTKETGKEQLEFIQSLIDNASPSQATGNAGDDESNDEEPDTPVDPNRPAITSQDLDPEQAGSILDQFKEWPGADFFRR
jgi:hypothetical protein